MAFTIFVPLAFCSFASYFTFHLQYKPCRHFFFICVIQFHIHKYNIFKLSQKKTWKNEFFLMSHFKMYEKGKKPSMKKTIISEVFKISVNSFVRNFYSQCLCCVRIPSSIFLYVRKKNVKELDDCMWRSGPVHCRNRLYGQKFKFFVLYPMSQK